jgi:TetR/AcrR family acrAB operon transcriptional repressor
VQRPDFKKVNSVARRTKEEAQETRQRLLDAAELLFQSQGVSQTTLQQIAQQAGATRGAIYWHFKDKAALFNAMMERVTLPLEAAVQQVAEDGSMEGVERMMVEALKRVTADPRMRRVFEIATHKVEYTHDMASVQRRHLDARNACVADFRKAMAAQARCSRLKLPIPASAAAHGLHALIDGLIQNWLLDPGAFDLVATGRRTFRVYLAGLGFGKAPLGAG